MNPLNRRRLLEQCPTHGPIRILSAARSNAPHAPEHSIAISFPQNGRNLVAGLVAFRRILKRRVARKARLRYIVGEDVGQLGCVSQRLDVVRAELLQQLEIRQHALKVFGHRLRFVFGKLKSRQERDSLDVSSRQTHGDDLSNLNTGLKI